AAPVHVSSPAAARHEDPLPRQAPAAALGEAWSPIPVPVPTYVNAPVAGRRPKVLDLTRPGEWSATLEGDDDAVLVEDGIDLDRLLDRRRAVND
ncbi:MAG: hypothetical protein M3O32_13685, partial [Actinomycetota bacterium]|nr:hypothetical protein [Actinomycetota bacterium]